PGERRPAAGLTPQLPERRLSGEARAAKSYDGAEAGPVSDRYDEARAGPGPTAETEEVRRSGARPYPEIAAAARWSTGWDLGSVPRRKGFGVLKQESKAAWDESRADCSSVPGWAAWEGRPRLWALRTRG